MTKIDIISGFLGAGKTTFANILLNYYINNNEKAVYIVNEFGQKGLDGKIISSNGFQAIEMQNGCVCCSLKNDVTTTIKEVIESFSPSRIVFEPSGIFVFENFLDIIKEDSLRSICEIGSVITIVDSVNFLSSKAKYGSFIYNQIKNSPCIILSKIEKSKNRIDEIICDIKNINHDCYIFAESYNMLNSDAIGYILDNSSLNNISDINTQNIKHKSFKTLTIKLKREYKMPELEEFAKKCINGILGDIVRVKGIINIAGKLKILNIALKDISIDTYRGVGEQSLTFIGEAINVVEIYKSISLKHSQ
jgi:G3E family GTPase